jgi:hypothetical protein
VLNQNIFVFVNQTPEQTDLKPFSEQNPLLSAFAKPRKDSEDLTEDLVDSVVTEAMQL